MIKSIHSDGKYMQVLGGTPPNTYTGSVGNLCGVVGNVRFNSSSQTFEVYDGTTWVTLQNSYASIGLTSQAESILDWAYKKMTEEAELEQLSKDNPAVAAAVENLNKAKEQLKATIILSKEYEKTTR